MHRREIQNNDNDSAVRFIPFFSLFLVSLLFVGLPYYNFCKIYLCESAATDLLVVLFKLSVNNSSVVKFLYHEST